MKPFKFGNQAQGKSLSALPTHSEVVNQCIQTANPPLMALSSLPEIYEGYRLERKDRDFRTKPSWTLSPVRALPFPSEVLQNIVTKEEQKAKLPNQYERVHSAAKERIVSFVEGRNEETRDSEINWDVVCMKEEKQLLKMGTWRRDRLEVTAWQFILKSRIDTSSRMRIFAGHVRKNENSLKGGTIEPNEAAHDLPRPPQYRESCRYSDITSPQPAPHHRQASMRSNHAPSERVISAASIPREQAFPSPGQHSEPAAPDMPQFPAQAELGIRDAHGNHKRQHRPVQIHQEQRLHPEPHINREHISPPAICQRPGLFAMITTQQRPNKDSDIAMMPPRREYPAQGSYEASDELKKHNIQYSLPFQTMSMPARPKRSNISPGNFEGFNLGGEDKDSMGTPVTPTDSIFSDQSHQSSMTSMEDAGSEDEDGHHNQCVHTGHGGVEAMPTSFPVNHARPVVPQLWPPVKENMFQADGNLRQPSNETMHSQNVVKTKSKGRRMQKGTPYGQPYVEDGGSARGERRRR